MSDFGEAYENVNSFIAKINTEQKIRETTLKKLEALMSADRGFVNLNFKFVD